MVAYIPITIKNNFQRTINCINMHVRTVFISKLTDNHILCYSTMLGDGSVLTALNVWWLLYKRTLLLWVCTINIAVVYTQLFSLYIL